ncbi:LysM peptidoglycan-binding domain-containing protein [Glaciecola sp. XM2]|jgi:hypothetical protein|uniref:LysM peptidoglycan-binding domain-containing protein n=1 Tax=Glaciecola sp. XM2 TaxID=1914931 RepID=UPI001BDF3E5B|nr:LysM domain-containing protein [Glaciecola sp. XM2]MBT1451607.1 LysM peptidoglycan-binding domain-containing protein [Glaciecola sp. XM2]
MHIKSLIVHSFALICLLSISVISSAHADVLNIRDDAPKNYEVKKGDTLWDISNLYLDRPWRWPELWRNNTQIVNPHLIYPGDMLRLRWENGQPVLEMVSNKRSVTLSPDSNQSTKPIPINLLPWDQIAMYINNDSIMTVEDYTMLPAILTDREGTARFVDEDFVLTRALATANAANIESFEIVRKEREVYDSAGRLLGVQVMQLSDADLSVALENGNNVVKVSQSLREVKFGDKLRPAMSFDENDLTLSPATTQVGELVSNINGHNIISKHDVVIVNLGSAEVSPGMVFGIYKQGPAAYHKDERMKDEDSSAFMAFFSLPEKVEQPAYKVGELIIIRGFDNASYGWVTDATTHLTGGEIVASPRPQN